MKKGIITIHGMGEQTSGYSKNFKVLLTKEFNKVKAKGDSLVFKEVEWSSILSVNEEKLFQNIKENLSFLGLRKFIIHSFGDAIAYQKTGSQFDTYNLINDLIKSKYDELVKSNVDEIYFVAHSLGGVILSNFIYDSQVAKEGITFHKLFTFGTTIPLWTLKYQIFDSPINLHNNQKWVNMYDSDDILGYPLGNISPDYQALAKAGKLVDIEVNSGSILTSWNPLCHLGYWTDIDVIRIIAEELK